MSLKNNTAIFAHYDKHGLIDEYVISYLENLKKFCKKIVFVSDGRLPDGEKSKILNIVDHIIDKRHGEYDFGSYKIGFNFLKQNPEEFSVIDRLIFANDSCYLVSGFDNIFAKIEQMPEIDAFAMTDSIDYSYHLESYFLIFQNNLFREKYFDDFLQSAAKQKSKIDVIKKYEVGFSELLKQNNKKLFAFFGAEFLKEYIAKNQNIIKSKIIKILNFTHKIFGLKRIHRTLSRVPSTYTQTNSFYVLMLVGCPLFKKTIPFKDCYSSFVKKFCNTSSLALLWKRVIEQTTNFDSKIISNYNSRMFMKTKVIILGKNGQVASNLIKLLQEDYHVQMVAYSSTDVDFSDLNRLENFLNKLSFKPDFIINASAYTNVDKAEDEQELADLINHKAVATIAKYCAENDIKLVHYSTDYVFDGSGTEAFAEDNTKNLNPLNHYGKTKLLGEKAIINSGCKYLIFRISWVWDDNPTAKNFANTIKKLAMEREVLKIINDQVGSPTKADFVAYNTIETIKRFSLQSPFPSGIYHLNNGEFMSWYDFALKIVENLKESGIKLMVKEIIPIKTSEYPTKATRPLNSRLNNSKLF